MFEWFDWKSFTIGMPAGIILFGLIRFANTVIRLNRKVSTMNLALRILLGEKYRDVLNEMWDESEARSKDLNKGIDKIIIH